MVVSFGRAHRPSLVLWLPLAVVTALVLCMNVARVFILAFYQLMPAFLDRFYSQSKIVQAIFSYRLSGGQEHADRGSRRRHSQADADADCFMDTPALVRTAGYPLETHYVRTPDGFLLVLHRIPRSPHRPHHDDDDAASAKPGPAVLLMHGLMLTSEAWLLNKDKSLAYQLADAGFDVWLGNNRGNKYSCKHQQWTPEDEQYWNFSLDELAMIDLPSMVHYVCKRTQQDQIAYVGFSNGSAQAFAGFSMDDELARKISIFIALAPAVKVRGLANSFASAVINSNNNYIYLVFGTKMMLSISIFWQKVLSTWLYVRVLDFCLFYLFNWSVHHWPPEDKPRIYYHIFSWTSVKHIVHWFQIITTGRFAMYDDTQRDGWFATPQYDISRIRIPLALFYGGRDTIINAPALLKAVRGQNHVTHFEPTYEHLDFLWADTAPDRIFPKICQILRHVANTPVEKRATVDLTEWRTGPVEDEVVNKKHAHH